MVFFCCCCRYHSLKLFVLGGPWILFLSFGWIGWSIFRIIRRIYLFVYFLVYDDSEKVFVSTTLVNSLYPYLYYPFFSNDWFEENNDFMDYFMCLLSRICYEPEARAKEIVHALFEEAENMSVEVKFFHSSDRGDRTVWWPCRLFGNFILSLLTTSYEKTPFAKLQDTNVMVVKVTKNCEDDEEEEDEEDEISGEEDGEKVFYFVVFRGTEPFDAVDWFKDLEVSAERFESENAQAENPEEFRDEYLHFEEEYGEESISFVHKGFKSCLFDQVNQSSSSSIWPKSNEYSISMYQKLDSYFANEGYPDIRICGHSLGAALSDLYGSKVCLDGKSKVLQISEFAVPMIGNEKYHQILIDCKVDVRRYLYVNDPIHINTNEMFVDITSREYYSSLDGENVDNWEKYNLCVLSSNGLRKQSCTDWKKMNLFHHFPGLYQMAIGRYRYPERRYPFPHWMSNKLLVLKIRKNKEEEEEKKNV